MFAYCNNNPVNMVDSNGNESIAVLLLKMWLEGNGEDVFFDENSSVSKTLKKSRTMKARINAAIKLYEDTGIKENDDSIIFTKYEPDLWLGIRRAYCKTSIIDEQRKTVSFLGFRLTYVQYTIEVTVSDTYNFNIGTETGDGFGSVLNNCGYELHKNGIGTDYKWESSFTFTTSWQLY